MSRRPGWVLFLASAAAVIALVMATLGIRLGSMGSMGPLGFESDRNALISPQLAWNQRFIDWQSSFPGKNDLWIVIDLGAAEGESAYGERLAAARAMAEQLAERLRAASDDGLGRPLADVVFWRFRADQQSPRALRMASGGTFERQVREICDQATLLQVSPTVGRLLANIAAQVSQAASQRGDALPTDGHSGLQRITALVQAIGGAVGDDPKYDFSGLSVRWQYLTSHNGRQMYMRVRPVLEADNINAAGAAIEGIKAAIAEASGKWPQIEVGLTGILAIETEETATATRDSARASVIAFALIAVLLIAAFHSWRLPLLVMVALLFGIAWTFGFATLAVGYLQVLSVVFTVILLGLGVAYGIHLAARFELVRHSYADGPAGFEPAMSDSVQTVGPGVVTGAVTTAAAFCTTLLTRFKGVAEMGVIAAAGIMLCLLAMFSVYPALLRLVKPKGKHIRSMDSRYVHFFEDRWVKPFARYPRVTLAAAGLLTVVSLVPIAVGRMTFDYDLLKLMPRGSASVRWQQRIAQDGGQPIYFGVSICEDLDEARIRTARLRGLSSVQEVGGVGLLFPRDESQKQSQLTELRQQLAAAPRAAATGRPVDLGQTMTGMQQMLRLSVGLPGVSAELRVTLDELDAALGTAIDGLAQLDESQRAERLSALDQAYGQWRGAALAMIDQTLDDGQLTIDDLPQQQRQWYVDESGRLALEIYPHVPDGAGGALDPTVLGGFVRDLRSIDREVTGPAVQIYASGSLIKRSYKVAGALALLVVFLLVALDFQRVEDAVLALVPVGVGFAMTFGLMYLVNVRINAANIIVLPLMFGIGVDSGVHILHRYRHDPQTRPLGLAHGTGKGITITSLTAVIGFGSLMTASHRGIASLGFVLATGILLTMFACWVIMPAWLELRSARPNRT